MKRFIATAAIAAALFVLPALSHAGSATSRWDLTIGGFVKFDMGYATQAQGADYTRAERGSYGTYESFADEYGNFFSAAGETRLNFLIKGPDGWGAKTLGFVEGEFRGTSGGSNYGTFVLRHAFMKMQWENDALTIGQTWQKWGYIPTYSNILLGVNMLSAFNRGGRQPQIMWDHTLNKNWNFSLGVISPTNSLGTAGGSTRVDSYTLSKYPFFEGELSYTSDACGKIGRWQMLFSLSGFYGWDRRVYNTAWTTSPGACGPGCVPGRPVNNPYAYDDDLETAWGASFKGFIPIIPEKKGNKSGALSLSGMLFASQNPSWYMGSTFALGPYNRAAATNPDNAYPRVFGGWGQLSYWFTNDLFISGWYGQFKYSLSDRYKNLTNSARSSFINNNVIEMERQFVVNLSYDVNPSMRLGLEWDYIFTKWANYGTDIPGSKGSSAPVLSGLYADRSGKLNAVRIGAWYFF